MEQAVAIPNKLYFRIGEVADLVGVKPYVLRYWETEFPDIKPVKSKSGQRLYKRRDVELLVMIKNLLYAQRFTITGARQQLKTATREQRAESATNGHPQMALSWEQAPPKPAVSKPIHAAGPADTATGKDQRKLLVKIKRDLEQMLETLQ